MRGFLGPLIASTLATWVAGCNVLELQYFREGIGSELYVANSVEATSIQDAYIGLICRQAGLPHVINADGSWSCAVGESSASWSLFVQAGMNDIDRRCDGYLAWLDDKRRSTEPFLRQLGAISAATLGILDATSASAKAITITGIAFGLAANTFTNVNARILSLEQSTIQSVVLDSQRKYRGNNDPSAVNSRPMAIYFLRNYLRICLPFSIETSVNNTVTVFHRAGAGALEGGNTLFTNQVVITDPRRELRAPTPRPQRPDGLGRVLDAEIVEFQQALCITKADGKLGAEGSETRRAILAYLSGLNRRPTATFTLSDAQTTTQLQRAVAEVGDCQQFQFASAFEVGALGVPATLREKKISEVQKKLKDAGFTAVNVTGTFDTATRAAIEKVRGDRGIAGSGGALNFPLYQAILGLKKAGT